MTEKMVPLDARREGRLDANVRVASSVRDGGEESPEIFFNE